MPAVTASSQITPLEDLFTATETAANNYTDAAVAPRSHMRRGQNGSTTIADSTVVKVQNFGTALDTTLGVAYANGDWTVSEAGRYALNAVIAMPSMSGYVRVYVYVNNSEVKRKTAAAVTGAGTDADVSMTMTLAATDVVSFRVLQTSGVSLGTVQAYTQGSVTWVGPA